LLKRDIFDRAIFPRDCAKRQTANPALQADFLGADESSKTVRTGATQQHPIQVSVAEKESSQGFPQIKRPDIVSQLGT
jgi:hypothetical protein